MYSLLLKLGAKPVQNQCRNLRTGIHSFPKRMVIGRRQADISHSFPAPTPQHFSQTVHKINAKLIDVGWHFSAQYTGPITTTTTFIYKNIERKAA
jgi:hypothetical protein